MAIITSYYFNGFEAKAQSINTKEADRVYNDLTNYKKMQISVSVKSLESLRKVIYTKFEPIGAIKLHSDEQSGYALYIYQIETQYLPQMLDYISQIGSISSKVERISPQNTQLDMDAKLRDMEAIYQKEFVDYNNSKTKYSYQLDRLKQLSTEVDSLKFQISNQKNRAMTLLYIKAQMPPNKVGKVKNYQKFVIDFLKYLIIYSVIVSFLHYGTVLLVYVLSMLGIRFPNIGSYGRGYNDYAGYKGYQGYGNYGYGGGRKRKVKRIYRNKKGEHHENEDDSNK
jgi:hypothetical protein